MDHETLPDLPARFGVTQNARAFTLPAIYRATDHTHPEPARPQHSVSPLRCVSNSLDRSLLALARTTPVLLGLQTSALPHPARLCGWTTHRYLGTQCLAVMVGNFQVVDTDGDNR